MSLRKAFAAALQHLRAHHGFSQQEVANKIDQSYVSRLEAAQASVTLEVSEELAEALQVHPMALLALVYSSKTGMSPMKVLQDALAEVEVLGMSQVHIPTAPSKLESPQAIEAAERSQEISSLLAEGKSQAEIARLLGVARSTISRHVKTRT
jgi:transcriptional regulator with XRE-family HTH domain